MSCDHELANEKTRCKEKNASYITISVVFLVFKSLLGIERQKNLKNLHFLAKSLEACQDIDISNVAAYYYARKSNLTCVLNFSSNNRRGNEVLFQSFPEA